MHREILVESAKEDSTTKEKVPESPERLARTIFVGNVSISLVKEKKLQRSFKELFSAYGKVESVRFRSLIGDKAMPKRVAYITGNTIEGRISCNAFVVMPDADSAVKAAEALNGALFEGHHLRVDLASNAEQKPATKKSVFVGNLPLNVNDESLWKVFESCGPISYVRVIRDKESGLGKGFGYVAFKEKAAVELALQLNGTKCEGRSLRISKCAKPGYQQVKKARYEKRAVVKQQFKNMKKSHQSQNEVGLNSTKASTEGRKTLQVKAVASMPKLEAKHKPITKEVEPTQSKHPAEIRKERKLAKATSNHGASTAKVGFATNFTKKAEPAGFRRSAETKKEHKPAKTSSNYGASTAKARPTIKPTKKADHVESRHLTKISKERKYEKTTPKHFTAEKASGNIGKRAGSLGAGNMAKKQKFSK